MHLALRLILLLSLMTSATSAWARIRWDEPEVVPEKLARSDRRVVRFSGTLTEGALIRIRKNRLMIYPFDGRARLAQIPQKNRVQFPVVANKSGRFSFDLYLPTFAVEIPLEIKERRGAWRSHTLNFKVPDSGKADDFQAIEESFKAQDERMDKATMDYDFYTRKQDQGLLIQDRGGKKGYDKSAIEVWGGLGFSYFHNSIDVPLPVGATSDGSLVIPTFRFGGEWDYSQKLRFKVAIRSTSGSTDNIGDSNTQGRDFNWFEGQLAALYFSDRLQSKYGRLAFDFGLQLQTLPYFRLRQEGVFLIQSAYFASSTYNLQIGLHYEKKWNQVWDMEAYARYLYPVIAGDNFDIESTFPLFFELGGGVRRPLTQGLALGVYGQLHYLSMETSYSAGAQSFTSDLSLVLMTVDLRLIADF